MAENSKSTRRHHAYNRKLKSLGLLCSNFVSLYNRDDVETIGLDEAAVKLGVERRRIYDIVNIMEKLGILRKKAKNRYLWIGFKGLPDVLQQLKEDAKKEQTEFNSVQSAARESAISVDEDCDKISDQNDDDGQGVSSTNDTSAKLTFVQERREKSLGQLTQYFVKLLLTTTADTVSLDEAAGLILDDGQDPSSMRNASTARLRRLYDIANVLSSLNLIEKTHQSHTRKPAFRWLGTKGSCGSIDAVSVSIAPAAQKTGKRTFGTELTNVDVKRRVISSVDSMPTKAEMPVQGLNKCSIAAQTQLHASKSFVFGPFNPPKSLKGKVFEEKAVQVLDFESLASSLCPSYHNQALHDLFTHYKEAYNSWFAEIAGGSSDQQLVFKEPLSARHS